MKVGKVSKKNMIYFGPYKDYSFPSFQVFQISYLSVFLCLTECICSWLSRILLCDILPLQLIPLLYKATTVSKGALDHFPQLSLQHMAEMIISKSKQKHSMLQSLKTAFFSIYEKNINIGKNTGDVILKSVHIFKMWGQNFK